MEAKKKILKLHESDSNFSQYLQNQESAEYDCLIKILNTHEFAAAGIRKRAYSETLYKHMRYSATIRDWEACAGFIAEFRRKHHAYTIWQEFEWLAMKWKRRPLKQIKK